MKMCSKEVQGKIVNHRKKSFKYGYFHHVYYHWCHFSLFPDNTNFLVQIRYENDSSYFLVMAIANENGFEADKKKFTWLVRKPNSHVTL